MKSKTLEPLIDSVLDTCQMRDVIHPYFSDQADNDKYTFFKMIGTFDPIPFLSEIYSQEYQFEVNYLRKSIIVQQHTDTIQLRHALSLYGNNPSSQDIQGTRDCVMAYFYPHTYNHVKKFAESLNAEMGWIGIVRLEPRSSVGLHFDQGYYYLIRDRYHLVLQSKGSIMHCEDKTSIWHAGEHWWFNNKKVHSATNDSDDWRIHVIFDLLPKKCSQFVGRVSGLQAYNPW